MDFPRPIRHARGVILVPFHWTPLEIARLRFSKNLESERGENYAFPGENRCGIRRDRFRFG